MREGCAVLDWAASGAMALTGLPGGPPTASPAPVLAMLGGVTAQLAAATSRTGRVVRADPAELLTVRAALAGLSRGGQVSAGGACYLLPAADGWAAVTLSRPDDVAAVPAIVGLLGLDSPDGTGPGEMGSERAVLAAAARGKPAAEFAAAAQLVGVPAAALPGAALPGAALPGAALPGAWPAPAAAGWPPWRAARIAPPSPGARLAGALVADLSSMWAGPLCARLLGLAGANVIKVESPARPDGARSGNPAFFDWLHAGHRSLAADFITDEGRSALAALLEAADVVIESSRPRALAAAGLAPDLLRHRDGQVWLSITGYGQAAPELVAFGDDAAVAGGLVGWTGGPASRGTDEPVFCADAVADPLTGICGALAVAQSVARGGGEHIDLPMAAVAGAFAASCAAGAGPQHGPHPLLPDGSVSCPHTGRRQAVLPPRAAPPGRGHAAALGADSAAVLGWLAGRPAC
jgi:crotonobetainyl-CoA:carnitine CoA-transferase CaiB-like acyl-CoA transferase